MVCFEAVRLGIRGRTRMRLSLGALEIRQALLDVV
jgi:hypothetical protein